LVILPTENIYIHSSHLIYLVKFGILVCPFR
jgi:hypothetical protein